MIQEVQDYEACASCGFDHEYEPAESTAEHARIGFVDHSKADDFLRRLVDRSVDLFVLDPPYFNIVAEEWDNQWSDESVYVDWLIDLLRLAREKMSDRGSLLLFGGIGKHGEHPFWKVCGRVEDLFFYRNMITWKKRRAYGKSHDYLFCREEIAWFSRCAGRTDVTFNIPLLDVKRGYAGFNPKYPAKSEFKRVSNVWDDIPELMRPARSCEKPEALYNRLIATHSNVGDLIVDFFAGTGNCGVSAIKQGRRFLGCDSDGAAVDVANRKLEALNRVAK